MDKKIVIVGNMLKCKKGIYIISTLKEDTLKIFKDLIKLIKDFFEKPDSKHFQIEITEKEVTILFINTRDVLVKDFENDDKSLKVLEKYNQALSEIEKLN